jgi:hypothetical protein
VRKRAAGRALRGPRGRPAAAQGARRAGRARRARRAAAAGSEGRGYGCPTTTKSRDFLQPFSRRLCGRCEREDGGPAAPSAANLHYAPGAGDSLGAQTVPFFFFLQMRWLH